MISLKTISKTSLQLTRATNFENAFRKYQTIERKEDTIFERQFKIPIGASLDHTANISVIHMNDDKTKNSLSKKTVYSFLEILNRFQYEPADSNQVRALILKSDVIGVFCAGANLKERLNMTNTQVEAWIKVQRSLMDALNDFPYPTIAAIDGLALGGGLELALACDIRIVNEKAKVGLVETRLAIIPGAGGTQRLTRLIGIGKAKEHIFLAEPIDGVEAVKIGIANHVVSGDEAAYDKAVELATKISKRGPKALRLAKAAIDQGSQTSLDNGLDIEQAYYGQLLGSADRIEGMVAFKEKREPVYKGE